MHMMFPTDIIYILLHILKYLNSEGAYCCLAYFVGVNR